MSATTVLRSVTSGSGLVAALRTPSAYLIAPRGRALHVSAAAASPSGSTPEPPNLKEVATMARIAVTDEEVADWEPKINSIVEWFGDLNQLDLEDVPPALRAAAGDDVPHTRPDEAVNSGVQEELLGATTHRSGAYITVPKISTGSSVDLSD